MKRELWPSVLLFSAFIYPHTRAWKQKHLAMRLSELPRHPARNPKLEQCLRV